MHRFLSATTVSAQDIQDLRDDLVFLSTLPGHTSVAPGSVITYFRSSTQLCCSQDVYFEP